MKKRHYTTVLTCFGFLLVTVVALITNSESATNASSQTPAIINMTSAVKVVLVKPDKLTGYQLVMKNVSAKNINGYSIGHGKGSYVMSELTSTIRPIVLPGEEFKQWIPVTDTLVVRYVIFDDNTIDGDAVAAAEQQDRRLGIREQLERIVPLFRIAGDVDQLKSEIEALPEESQVSMWVTSGMRSAKQDALLALQKLDRSNVRAGLDKFVAASESRMARLPGRANP